MSVNSPGSNISNSNLIYKKISEKPKNNQSNIPSKQKPVTQQTKHRTSSALTKPSANKNTTTVKAKTPLKLQQEFAILSSNTAENFYRTIGFGIGLVMLRKLVNEKLLLKLYSSFSKKVKDTEKIKELALKMRKEHGLENIVPFEYGQNGEAYFEHNKSGQRIVLGKDSLTAAFHELGHAVIENKTKLLKEFQDTRGIEATGAITLYMLIESLKFNQRNEQNNNSNSRKKIPQKESFKEKLYNSILKYSEVVPLLIYSPELISEAGATKFGLKFLKKELKSQNINKNFYKNIRNNYIAAFSTYLFIPLSLIVMSTIERHVQSKIITAKQSVNNTLSSLGIGAAAAAAGGGLSYASKSIIDKNDYTEEFLRKLVQMPKDKYLNHGYPKDAAELIETLNTIYKVNDIDFIQSMDKSKVIFRGVPLSELLKIGRTSAAEEIDKVYDKAAKKFKKQKDIPPEYLTFQKDVKSVARSVKAKSVKAAAWACGFSAAYISYSIGRLFPFNPKKHNKKDA